VTTKAPTKWHPVRLPEEYYERLRVLAAERDMKIQALLERAVRQYLAKQKDGLPDSEETVLKSS